MDIVNKGKWNQSTAIQISPDGLQNLKSEGYVTKKYDGYGCIDKNTLFKFDVVQGPTPSIGDKVQYEAQRTTAASHWNATKVKVVQFAVPHTKQGPEPTGPGLTQQFPNPYQQEYYQKNQNQLPGNRFSGPNTFTANKPQNINFITGGSNFGIKPAQGIFQQQQTPTRPSNNAIPPFGMAVPPPPVPMPQIVAPPTTVMYPQQTAVFRPQQNRFSQAIQVQPPNLMGTFNTQSDRNRQLVQRVYRDEDSRGFSRRSRSPERRDNKTSSRKKSRSPRRRSRSRSPGRRSRSPRRKRSPPRVRYSVSITKFNLMRGRQMLAA